MAHITKMHTDPLTWTRETNLPNAITKRHARLAEQTADRTLGQNLNTLTRFMSKI